MLAAAAILVSALARDPTATAQTVPDDDAPTDEQLEELEASFLEAIYEAGVVPLRFVTCAVEDGEARCYSIPTGGGVAYVMVGSAAWSPDEAPTWAFSGYQAVTGPARTGTTTITSTTADIGAEEAAHQALLQEVDAAVAPSINAWLASPSGPAYDAIVAALAPFVDRWEGANRLAPYPGSDNSVIRALADLQLPSVRLPWYVNQGTYRVGDDIPPGTYRAQNVENCYWATLDQAGEINDNNFVSAAPQVLAQVQPSDYAFENDCGFMVKVD